MESQITDQFCAFEAQEAELEKNQAAAVTLPPYDWQITPRIATISYPAQDNNRALILAAQSIEKMKKGDNFYGLYFLITNTEFLTTLAKKHTEGVNINLFCCASQKNAVLTAMRYAKLDCTAVPIQFYNEQQLLKNNGYAQKLHTKTMAWSYVDANQKRQYRAYSGSQNITNMANREMAEYAVEQATYEFVKNLFEAVSDIHANVKQETIIQYGTKNTVLQHTPPGKTIISSLNYNLNKSIATIIKNCQEGDSCYINMYSWDDRDTKEAALQLANKKILKLVTVDKDALKKQPTQEFLVALYKKGVPVSVFNYDEAHKTGKFAQSNHIKGFARITKNNSHHVLGFGSNNWTNSSNNDINVLHFDIDQTKTEEFINNCNAIATQSKPLNFIIPELCNHTNKRKSFETYDQEYTDNKDSINGALDSFALDAVEIKNEQKLKELFKTIELYIKRHSNTIPKDEGNQFIVQLNHIYNEQLKAINNSVVA
ncbi:MAG: phospholipase D-like domain-containing protein [Candidatus Babeliales bacterium]